MNISKHSLAIYANREIKTVKRRFLLAAVLVFAPLCAMAKDKKAVEAGETAAFEERRAKWLEQAYAEYPELKDLNSPLRKEAHRLSEEYKRVDHQILHQEAAPMLVAREAAANLEASRKRAALDLAESEVAKTPEYQAAKSAERSRDGATMLVQAKLLVARFPESALVHKAMADAYYYMNFLDEAATSAQKAIQINPKDPIAWRNLGHIRFNQNKLDEAETAYKNAVNADQNDPTPLADLGEFYSKRANVPFALQCATRASTLLNSTPYNDHYGESPEAWAWRSVGFIFTCCKRPADGVTHLKRSISLQPDDAQTWLLLAMSYGQQNDRTNALSAIKQALKLDPNCDGARLALESLAPSPPQQPQAPQPNSNLTIEQMQQLVELAKAMQDLRNRRQQEEVLTTEQLKQSLELFEQLKAMQRR